MRNYAILATVVFCFVTSCKVEISDTHRLDSWESIAGEYASDSVITVSEGEIWFAKGDWRNFSLTGKALTSEGSTATIQFHSDGNSGYEVILHNGPMDGTVKTGSLAAIRNLYRTYVNDGEWFDFEISVRGKNITVKINGNEAVCYTEPDKPYRKEEFKTRLLSEGKMVLKGYSGKVFFKEMVAKTLPDDAISTNCPPVNEQTDSLIRLEQAFFPIIDWHSYLPGEIKFKDAMTITDHRGRICRLDHDEDIKFDSGISWSQYMDVIVNQTVKTLSQEPVDIYTSPTFIPKKMADDYDTYWTERRINEVLDVLVQNGIALEINSEMKLPNFRIIKLAKARGVKFTFGSGGENFDFGKMYYCSEAIRQCNLSPSDMWFPSSSRDAAVYKE